VNALHTYQATRRIAAPALEVRAALAQFAADVWSAQLRSIVDEPGLRVDAITTNPATDEADVWLEWQLAECDDGTHVRVVVAEVDQGPDPSVEVHDLLRWLEERVTGA